MVKVCIELDIDRKLLKLLELAGIDISEVVKRVLDKVLSSEIAIPPETEREESSIKKAVAKKPEHREILEKMFSEFSEPSLNWRHLVELYLAGRRDKIEEILAQNGVSSYRTQILRCIDVLAYSVKNPSSILYSDKENKFYVIESNNTVFIIRLHTRVCHIATKRKDDANGIESAIRKLYPMLADNAIRAVLPKRKKSEGGVFIVDEEKIRKARERLILEREAWRNR